MLSTNFGKNFSGQRQFRVLVVLVPGDKVSEVAEVQVVKAAAAQAVELLHRVERAVANAHHADAYGVVRRLDHGLLVPRHVAHVPIRHNHQHNVLAYALLGVCL